MYGPYHEFLLLPEGEAGKRIYTDFWEADPEAESVPRTYRAFCLSNYGIRVPDALICYMMDTLEWVPTEHPFEELGKWAMPWRGNGLDYHGHTSIRKRGAPLFRHVCESWAALFSVAPRNFTLTGGWHCDDERYETIECHRKEVVPLLQRLAEQAERAISGEFFILHVGL